MPNNQNKKGLKNLGGFWPIFIIVIVSMIAGGVVYAFASGNIMQDEIYSVTFPPLHYAAPKTAGKLPVKPVVKKRTTVNK